jgi:hypothetical protein
MDQSESQAGIAVDRVPMQRSELDSLLNGTDQGSSTEQEDGTMSNATEDSKTRLRLRKLRRELRYLIRLIVLGLIISSKK